MEEDTYAAASIPLPVSAIGTPRTPAGRAAPWFKNGIFSSPQSIIEIVPPTPPSQARSVNMDSPGPTPRATPRAIPRPVAPGTPSSGRRALNRMSKTFHAGTPPPVVRLLDPSDAARSPVSHRYVKDGRRSSIVAVHPQHRANVSSGSRRQSMLSMNDPNLPAQMQERLSIAFQEQEAGILPNRPILEHKETITSEDTFVSYNNNIRDPNSRSSSMGSSEANSMRVDPLTLLERRRRRDFTIGSHHPHHPPPNTPETPSLQTESDPEEIQSVKLSDIVDRFRTVFTRFSDMPWVAEPCVATLVIPQSITKEEKPPAGWYRKRPGLDEILGENNMEEGNIEHDESMSAETIVPPPPIPRKEAKWFPKKPEPLHFFGRERFSGASFPRSIVQH